MDKLRIDSHQHFWQYNSDRHTWMSADMKILKTDFLPTDLVSHLQNYSFEGCVAVQADQSEEENSFLIGLSEKYDFIKGIVGWVDFEADDLEDKLVYYRQFPKMKGFRHVLQDEAQRDFMLRSSFMQGISKLAKYGYTYDILIFTDQLPYTLEFVRAFPKQMFVIDHIGKPFIKQQAVGEWKDYMKKIASFENVYCKISGLVTEANWKGWKKEDFTTYLDSVAEAFGTDRIMYGSDWPVCLLAASYEEVFGIVNDYFSGFSLTEQDKFFGGNAANFYGLNHRASLYS